RGAGVPLLRGRLAPPALPDGLVERPRLRALLTAGARRAVTLVAAPAGWGKTVLLTWWSRTTDRPVAWLSVEPGDTDDDFWRYLYAALNADPALAEVPAPGTAPGDVPTPGTVPHDGFLARLVAALARRPAPLVLVLDDLHHLPGTAATSGGATAGLEFLVRHSAGRLRLVIGTRVDPPLPLHRLCLSGALTEIRTDQLAFTLAEAVELLTGPGPALPAGHVASLYARAEGWPAGLRLAGLAARRGEAG